MIFVVNGASGQQIRPNVSPKPFPVLNYKDTIPAAFFLSKPVIPGDFSTRHLAFFCKQELKFETITKIPLKFRLGSVQYCDRMEGKSYTRYTP
jgi:hypothetical protein